MKLINAQIQRAYRIADVNLPPADKARLAVLGLLPPRTVTVLYRKKSGTGVIRLRGTRYAVGAELCRAVEVELL